MASLNAVETRSDLYLHWPENEAFKKFLINYRHWNHTAWLHKLTFIYTFDKHSKDWSHFFLKEFNICVFLLFFSSVQFLSELGSTLKRKVFASWKQLFFLLMLISIGKGGKHLLGRICSLQVHPFPLNHNCLLRVDMNTMFYWSGADIYQMIVDDIFLMFAPSKDCWYSLKPPGWSGSNAYPQFTFVSKHKKNH